MERGKIMIVHEELKEVVKLNKRMMELSNTLFEKTGADGLHLESAEIINDCVAENGHLYNADGEQLDNRGLVNNEYYCFQVMGYVEYNIYGTLYYATDEEGVFIKIPFSC